MLRVEEFYQVLLWAERIAPESDPSDPRSLLGSLKDLLLETADQIAKELDPRAPSEIRSYRNIEDCRIVEAMLYHLVEQSTDREHEGLPRFWVELGMTNVLNAPVGTPSEFSQWLMAEHRALIDGIACARCSKPVPYDDGIFAENNSEGRPRYMHGDCYEAFFEERQQELKVKLGPL